MMIGANVGNICPHPVQLLCADSFFIHRNRLAFNPVHFIDCFQFLVSRILDGIYFILPNQLSQNTVQIFRTGTHNNLIRVHRHSPKSF